MRCDSVQWIVPAGLAALNWRRGLWRHKFIERGYLFLSGSARLGEGREEDRSRGETENGRGQCRAPSRSEFRVPSFGYRSYRTLTTALTLPIWRGTLTYS